MDDIVVSVRGLSHRYSLQWAIKDISFDIPAKGIFGLLGSNGAGKSTILNCMCGYLKPDEGNVFINGTNLYENFDALKQSRSENRVKN